MQGSRSGQRADCTLISRDRAGLSFIVRHSSNPQPTVTVDVVGADGGIRQTLVEQVDTSAGKPTLLELSDDGRDQLIVPLRTGTANTTYAVYRATDSAPDFVRAGEIIGVGVDRTASGYVVGNLRGSPAGRNSYTSFWRFLGSQLHLVAATKTTVNPAGPNTCTIDDADEGGHGKAPKVTEPALAQRFCAEEILRAAPVQ
ncbi:hypothetical protein [Nocardia sp. NPDC050406]|uniref:hypothetical protein n=1 Tax=Nocardia sp. NPDC050406 TaxID=3364318 RepID=UPI0037AC2829